MLLVAVATQQVSGSRLYRSIVCYSATVRIYIANKAAQKIYNKHNVQVVAKCDRSPPALAATAPIQHRAIVMAT